MGITWCIGTCGKDPVGITRMVILLRYRYRLAPLVRAVFEGGGNDVSLLFVLVSSSRRGRVGGRDRRIQEGPLVSVHNPNPDWHATLTLRWAG